jgi:hypothetical protein
MTQPPATTEKKVATAPQPLVPPEERFWQRYSPHHEFPLSGALSITLHAVALGVLAYLAFRFTSEREEDKPVRIEVAEIDGAEGNLDGLGLGTSLFKPEKNRPAEVGANSGGSVNTAGKPDAPPDKSFDFKTPKGTKLELPKEGDDPDPGKEGKDFTDLDKTVQGIEHSIAMAANPQEKPGGSTRSGKDEVNEKGSPGGPLGKGGKGIKGNNPGAGSSPSGKVLSTLQKRQMRWKILASEDGKTHLAKLRALKVTLVVPTRAEGIFKVMDLARPSPTFETTRLLANQGGKVWWTNAIPQHVAGLATVLGIERPRAFVIFLPKALEERMLELERDYSSGRSEDEIELTTWDVPFRDGHYAREPIIVDQKLRGR